MRVSKQHLDALREVIGPLDTEDRRERYRTRDIPRAELVEDIDKRYRWDLYWAAGGRHVVESGDYSDAHIDTALRAVVPSL